jgi:hypothetical protein
METVMRSSLLVQKSGNNKAGKYDFVVPNEVRTSTVVKNLQNASRQNLMIISGEGNQT